MNTPAAILIGSMILLCGYLLDYEKRQPDIKIVNCHGEVPITVKMADGKELYPLKAYTKPNGVQLIMTDGRAITMAWAQVEVIVFAGNKE